MNSYLNFKSPFLMVRVFNELKTVPLAKLTTKFNRIFAVAQEQLSSDGLPDNDCTGSRTP